MNPIARDVIADIIAEHAQHLKPVNKASAAVPSAFAWFQANAAMLEVPLDQGSRARALRAIRRIARMYRWEAAVERELDRFSVANLEALDDSQLFAIRDRMESLVDGAMTCCDLEDELPAR